MLLQLGVALLWSSLTSGNPAPTLPEGDWLDGCPNGDGDGSSSGRRDGSRSVGSAITDLLFSSLNMSYPGLARVAAAHNVGNVTGACNEVGLRVNLMLMCALPVM